MPSENTNERGAILLRALADHHGLPGADVVRLADPDALARCADGQEHDVLAELVEQRPWLARTREEPQPADVDWSGGVREPIPEPTDPLTAHNQFVLDLARRTHWG